MKSIILFIPFFLLSTVFKSLESKFPMILDIETGYPTVFKKTISFYGIDRNIQYIGPPVDTFQITHFKNSNTPIGNNIMPLDEKKMIITLQQGKIDVLMDTTIKATMKVYEGGEPKYYKSYPILLENKGDSTTIIGLGYHAFVFLQKKNRDGTWVDIETPPFLDCAVGVNNILLPKESIAIILAPLYLGEKRYTLRYRIGENYSTEFYGAVPTPEILNESDSDWNKMMKEK